MHRVTCRGVEQSVPMRPADDGEQPAAAVGRARRARPRPAVLGPTQDGAAPGAASTGSPAGTPHRPLGVRRLLAGHAGHGFLRLVTTRVSMQWSDGMFQAGLGGAVLFNPERQANPLDVAIGLIVLLLPYSVIGPFAGTLLDRWDRRGVMLVASGVRAGLVVLTALLVMSGAGGFPLYTSALLVTGVSRFLLSGLSAALPHVVVRRHLIEANAVSATVGAAVTALGATCAIGLRGLIGSGNVGSGLTTGCAVAGTLVGMLLLAGFRRHILGPDASAHLPEVTPDQPAEVAHVLAHLKEPADAHRPPTVVAVAHGLIDGWRAAAAAPGVLSGFCAMAGHRLAFGASTLISLLLFRYSFTTSGMIRSGLAGIGEAVAAGAIGVVLAALITPPLAKKFGRQAVIRGTLLVAGVGQLAFGLPLIPLTVLIGAFLVSCAGQVIKLCLDSSVQDQVIDAARGRVFAFYDMIFNVAYVAAVAGTALLVPLSGRSRGLIVAAGVIYLLALAGHVLLGPRDRALAEAVHEPTP
jgi:hypothetical protein